jgi:tRNA threonylcarbamoyladenosine biosynthesis protein TsaB
MLLAINTCGHTASVALGRIEAKGLKILSTADLVERTSSVRLVPEIAAMLAKHQATVQDLEVIVVVNGPGSFTGIRVGVSTAKGLAEGAGAPLIAVSGLALLAHASMLPHVLAAMDAGRSEYYVGEYRNGKKLHEMLLTGEEIVALAREPGAGVVVCEETSVGEGSGNNKSTACSALAICGPVYAQTPDAAMALRFALGRFRRGDFDDPETLEANYLRRSDAEVLREAKAAQ